MTQQIKENGNNTNIMWKAIRSCIPKKSASQSFFSGDVNAVANEFNNFFVNVGKNTIQKINTLAEQFQCEAYDFPFTPQEYPVSEQFVFDANVNINQVQKIVESMAPNKSPGIEKFHFVLLRIAYLLFYLQLHRLSMPPFFLLNFPMFGKLRK